ncbi:DOMON domain-containing protein [Trichostrongylus colubriformis]|uniref:DOMON domain-containing protein n=1 Tax=Trichostrongylus colubriformis TaxID=6319 RepID=A0AAN8FXJ5_TRICO
MVATSLIPTVPQQYIAIAFSNDAIMGEDFVTECVLSDMGQFAGWEPEIFVSFNHGKANDRVYLNDDEHRQLISNISSQVVDGRLVCHFTQQIVPQIDRRNGLIWSLDKPFYIMGATGSAQPDEVNAHDTNRGSHFYPIVSSARINPSEIGGATFDEALNTNSDAQGTDSMASATTSTPFVTNSPIATLESESSSVASLEDENLPTGYWEKEKSSVAHPSGDSSTFDEALSTNSDAQGTDSMVSATTSTPFVTNSPITTSESESSSVTSLENENSSTGYWKKESSSVAHPSGESSTVASLESESSSMVYSGSERSLAFVALYSIVILFRLL